MRAVVLRTLAVVGIGAAVLALVLYVASTVDGRGPTVAGIGLTQPLPDDPSRALITTSLEVAFSEPVDQPTAADALMIEPAVAGSVSWSGASMIFTPRDPLRLATRYSVTLGDGVRDLAGNAMTADPAEFAFETVGPPDIAETVPVDGAESVALADPVRISFTTLMDTASVEAALGLNPAFPHTLRWSGQVLEILPDQPLQTDREYTVRIDAGAFDVSGVALAVPLDLRFRTIASGLDVAQVLPADDTDGIAPGSSIAVIFDRGIDAGSIADELLTITPAVGGSLAVVDAAGDMPATPDDGRVLLFTPSGPLPATTTFSIELAPGLMALDGGALAQPIAWSFTTGAPLGTLSNQITFLSDRSGIANLWAMNVDGTAPRQLSSELSPVLDYAIAPDGGAYVIGDGRRLVRIEADGSDRRMLTEAGMLEFDPTFSPDGRLLAFARADAATGTGLGIWERPAGGGDASPVTARPDPSADPTSTAVATASTDAAEVPDWRRAPVYSPDGGALAFVDTGGWVGIVDLAEDAVTRAPFHVEVPPLWLADGSGVALSGRPADGDGQSEPYAAPVAPLTPAADSAAVVLDRGSDEVVPTALGAGATVVDVAPDGRIAYLRDDGAARISAGPNDEGRELAAFAAQVIGSMAFAPGAGAEGVVAVILPSAGEGSAMSGRLVRVDGEGSEADELSADGWRPRWLP